MDLSQLSSKLRRGAQFNRVLAFRLLNLIGLNCDSKRRGVSNDGSFPFFPNSVRLVSAAN